MGSNVTIRACLLLEVSLADDNLLFLSCSCRNRVFKMSRGYSTRSTSGSGSHSDSASVPTPVSTGSLSAVQQSSVSPATSAHVNAPATIPQHDLKTSAPPFVEPAFTTIAPSPKTWLDRLPSALQPMKPYLELTRIDKPIGTWLLYWPCGEYSCELYTD
jgi:hypothetical protein